MKEEPIVKIAISLPKGLLRRVDRRRGQGLSRSAYFRDAVREKLERDDARRDIDRYLEGYRTTPEEDREIDAARASAAIVLAEEPWE